VDEPLHLELIRRVPLFADLSAEEIATVVEYLKTLP